MRDRDFFDLMIVIPQRFQTGESVATFEPGNEIT